MERTPRTTKLADNTRTGGATRARPPRAPTDCLRWHVLRPGTGGARSGAGAHGRRAPAMPRPRSGGPERGTAAVQPSLPPASCSCAPQQHGRLARSEAARRRHSAQAIQSSRRPSCTCCGSRWELQTAAAGAVRMGRRGGQGLRGHGGLGRLAVCTCWLTPTQGRRSQLRSDPARPLRLAADAAKLTSRPLLPLPAAAKAAQKITSMQPPPAAPETASPAAASRQQHRRAGSLRPPHWACAAAGAGSAPKLAARGAPGGRGGGGGGGPTAPRHDPRKVAPTTLNFC